MQFFVNQKNHSRQILNNPTKLWQHIIKVLCKENIALFVKQLQTYHHSFMGLIHTSLNIVYVLDIIVIILMQNG